MLPPGRILELIEAIEVSAEKRNYELSTKQRILISKLKVKAEKDMWVSNNYWELLCDMFNEVEGRKNPHRESIEEAISSHAALGIALLFTIAVFFSIVILIWGFTR